MRISTFEASVIREDGTPYTEVTEEEEDHTRLGYVVAEPQQSFRVYVAKSDTDKRDYRVKCRIDGRCPGVEKLLYPDVHLRMFEGFNVSEDFSKFRAFTFSEDVEASTTGEASGACEMLM